MHEDKLGSWDEYAHFIQRRVSVVADVSQKQAAHWKEDGCASNYASTQVGSDAIAFTLKPPIYLW